MPIGGVSDRSVGSVIEEGYDWLAVGNSITMHPVSEHWWGEWGMVAATYAESDYFHVTLRGLEASCGGVNSRFVNFCAWEIQVHDWAETFEALDAWLAPERDFVTAQFSKSFVYLYFRW